MVQPRTFLRPAAYGTGGSILEGDAMKTLDLTVESRSGSAPLSATIDELVIGGWAGRDKAAMEHHTVKENPTVEEILAVEQETYDFIESRW